MVSDFTVASCLGDGDGNAFRVDIKAQIQYMLVRVHFYVVCWLPFTWFVRLRLNAAPRTCG